MVREFVWRWKVLISNWNRPQEHWCRALARFLYYHVTADLTGHYVGTVLAFARSLGEFGATITLCRTFLVKREPFLLPCIP